MNYNYSNSILKNLNIQLINYKDFLSLHQNKIKNYNINENISYRIPFNSKIKCSSNKCPKLATYNLNNLNYCWFHHIDKCIKN